MSRTLPFRMNGESGGGPLPSRSLRRVTWTGATLGACAILAGCVLPGRDLDSLAPKYAPENVFLYAPALRPDLKRVAVLPLACEDRRADLADGCETLNPILDLALIKTRKFEIVPTDPKILRDRTGRSGWTGAEVLPPDFFDSLREVYACDAVLFCQLTVFRAYKPLAVGWRLRLVDARTRQTLWEADELFDAGQQAVLNGAMHYQRAELRNQVPGGGGWLMQNSPRQFSQYAAAQVLETLPRR